MMISTDFGVHIPGIFTELSWLAISDRFGAGEGRECGAEVASG